MLFLLFLLLQDVGRAELISCPNWENIVRSLPKMDILKIICSYSGQITVNEKDGSKYFYWFFIKTYYTHLEAVPIMFHLGDGMHSSLLNVFSVLGPITIEGDEYFESETSYRNISNVVYVDYPGFGFALTDNHNAANEDKIKAEFYNFFFKFFEMYSVLKKNKFYIIGMKYTAKLAVMIGSYLQTMGFSNFGGAIVNNPIFDYAFQGKSVSSKGYNLGIYNSYVNNIISSKLDFSQAEIEDKAYYCYTEFTKSQQAISDILLKSYSTDIRENKEDTSTIDAVNNYFNQMENYKGDISAFLHVSDYYKINIVGTTNVLMKYLAIYTQNSHYTLSKYLSMQQPLLINVGSNVGFIDCGNLEEYLSTLSYNQSDQFTNADKLLYRIDNQNLLYGKSTQLLSYLVYPNEGIELGEHSPAAILTALEFFFKNASMPYAPLNNTKIQHLLGNCNNGEYKDGRCWCKKGFTGLACEIEINSSFSGVQQFQPSEKKYFSLNISKESTLELLQIDEHECNNMAIYLHKNSCLDCEYDIISHTMSLFYNINTSNVIVVVENKNHTNAKMCKLMLKKYLDTRTVFFQDALKAEMIMVIMLMMLVGICWVKSKVKYSLTI